MKIVINRCYGGFGLSDKAVERYAELIGRKIYKDKNIFGYTYYFIEPEDFHRLYDEAKKVGDFSKCSDLMFRDNNLERNDPLLVQVVEELGSESWDKFAELKVIEIPDDVEWEISEYDGMETVNEKHRTWN